MTIKRNVSFSLALSIAVSAAIFMARPAIAVLGIGEEGFDDLFFKVLTKNLYTDYTRITIEGNKNRVITGLFARKGELMRIDMDMRKAEKVEDEMGKMMLWTGTIIRPPEKKTFILYHLPKKYIVMKPDDEMMPPQQGDVLPIYEEEDEDYEPPKVELIKIGQEKFDGHPCVVYRIIVTWKNGKKREGKGWQAQDYKIKPWLKLEVYYPEETPKRTEVIELHNLKLGNPDDSLFWPPKDYEKINNIMEMFGKMMGALPMGN